MTALLISPLHPLAEGSEETRRFHWDALRASRWVAERTAERLPCVRLFEERISRDALPEALAIATGLAFFGHGGEIKTLTLDQRDLNEKFLDGGHAEPLLDRHNTHLLTGRWLHAFACRAGTTLLDHAATAGATCAVGYESVLVMEWTPEDVEALPLDVREAFVSLTTGVTLALVGGEVEATALCAAIVEAQGRLMSWCDENPGLAPGVEILAQQLVARMVVRRETFS